MVVIKCYISNTVRELMSTFFVHDFTLRGYLPVNVHKNYYSYVGVGF